MSIAIFAVTHRTHGLPQVAEACQHSARIANACQEHCHPTDDSWAILATCNRFELLVDVVDGQRWEALRRATLGEMPGALLLEGGAAERHVFEVACGLDSLVVGEREIVSQIRRSMEVSAGHMHGRLRRLVDAALSASRQVAQIPGVQRSGVALVQAALNVAEERGLGAGAPDAVTLGDAAPGNAAQSNATHSNSAPGNPVPAAEWGSVRALVVGTGSYAGAVVRALVERGCGKVTVFSTSGRAERFVARMAPLVHQHGAPTAAATVTAAEMTQLEDLPGLVAQADVVVCVRGKGPVITQELMDELQRTPVIVDLAVPGDVEPRVAARCGAVTMEGSAARVPESARAVVEQARGVAWEAAGEFAARERERGADHLVVELREHIQALAAEELAGLPAGEDVPRAEVERLLHRLVGRLAHGPSALAHKRAREGDVEGVAEAVAFLTGKDTENP
ncbi:MAG: hypothetical protein KH384_07425 [Corynebacteriales bacterium]|nr:hypothetical protein [Mycobacteriales bacterium]